MDTLPDDFAATLGRYHFFAGHADYMLGLLLTQYEEEPNAMGLSGGRLRSRLERFVPSHDGLRELLDGYEAMYERRNVLAHGVHHFSALGLETWYIPIGGKGATAWSFQHSREQIEGMMQSWRNIVEACIELLD
ncbi:MAG: hypothetical protein V9F00_17935 [Nocardioides sp.]